ncbi:MFS transporter [Streptomyces collinus]|uniref:MFS transporter n=1 Tax=Streptomyces collinus TaxID=42684 RepID=UPI003680B860
MPLAATPPSVIVVIDPGDDVIHTHTALAAHHPPSGRVTLYPGPGTTSETGLAYDLLAALGKPPLLPGRFPGGRQPAWEAATAWITALPVTRLTVLRAHRLTARRTMRLLQLQARTGLHLTLVCHRPHLPAALLTLRAAGSLAGAVLGGAWTDRLGARRATLLWLGAGAVATMALLAVRGPIAGAAVLVVYGVVAAALMAALGALIGVVTPAEQRAGAYSAQNVLANAGSAGGALAAALALQAWPSAGYTALYSVDAASFLVCAVVIWRWVKTAAIGESQATGGADAVSCGGYRVVAGDRAMRWLWLIAALVVAAGYCQLQVGIPGLASEAGLPATGLGWIFAANMITVIALQPLAQHFFRRFRRSTGVLAGVLAVAIAWGLLQTVPHTNIAVLTAAGCALAASEVLLSPIALSLVNDLAPATLRGRYNGAYVLAWTGGWLAGTLITGAVLGARQPQLLLPIWMALLAIAAAAGLRLRHHLPTLLDQPPPRHHPAPSVPATP